ncbi:MAG: nicotinamidase [bacterium]
MASFRIGPRDALIVVDLQVDFCPGGSLAVPSGDEIVAPVNRLLGLEGWRKAATRDWHPADHLSFKDRGGIWPPHCVAGTPGAEFHPGMAAGKVDEVVSKGDRADAEAYSGFDGTPLAADLRAAGVSRIFVCGLATDYCVRATALDGRREGLEVVLLEDAVRAVDVEPGDGERALEEMRAAGCAFARSGDIQG